MTFSVERTSPRRPRIGGRRRRTSLSAHGLLDKRRPGSGTPYTRARPDSEQSEFRRFDATFPEALVIFLAGVLHHFPVGPQREGPGNLPRRRERFRIVDEHLVDDVT